MVKKTKRLIDEKPPNLLKTGKENQKMYLTSKS